LKEFTERLLLLPKVSFRCFKVYLRPVFTVLVVWVIKLLWGIEKYVYQYHNPNYKLCRRGCLGVAMFRQKFIVIRVISVATKKVLFIITF
jgi:hypothetical protein